MNRHIVGILGILVGLIFVVLVGIFANYAVGQMVDTGHKAAMAEKHRADERAKEVTVDLTIGKPKPEKPR